MASAFLIAPSSASGGGLGWGAFPHRAAPIPTFPRMRGKEWNR